MDKPKLLIVEDHELARFGLSMALEEKGLYEMSGEAENGQQAIDLVKQNQPDVVLMDIGMPILDGISATQQIKKDFPEIKVIMLTSRQEEEEVFASLAAGADAYCMKDIKIDRLVQVLEMVLDGVIWLDPAIAKVVMQAIPRGDKSVESDNRTPQQRRQYNTELTEREQEVLQLVVNGKSNKEIAQELKVTTHTAKAHVCNIIQKLAVDDRTQVAVKALKEGLVKGSEL